MHSKITRHERQNVSFYLYNIYIHVYLLYISVYPSIYQSIYECICLSGKKLNCTQSLFVSAMCSTGDLCFYYKHAIIVPMRTLKFGSFTDIKSVVLF